MKWISRRPSPAMVIALIALFVSLSGVSYGVATGFIDSREIKNNEVRSLDIRNNEVRTRDLRNNEVRGIDIRNSTVQSRDIAINGVTGEDVKEDTLAKVPSALLADTATKANSATTADGVSGLKVINTTMAKDAADATLATHGPLSLIGECEDVASDTVANLRLDTTEDNTIAGDHDSSDLDLDASEMPSLIRSVPDAISGTRSAQLVPLYATALSGAAFTGNVSVQSEATSTSSGSCRFQGFVILQG
jgi:hypothetical protein